MSVFKKSLAVAAAFAMVGAPVAASAAPASKPTAVSAPVNGAKSSKVAGSTAIVALLALAAIIGGVAVSSSGSSKPKSP